MDTPEKSKKTSTGQPSDTTPVVSAFMEVKRFSRLRKVLNLRSLLYLLAVLIVCGVAYFFLTGGFNRHTVKIGDTSITKKDVTAYAKQLAAYEKAHPGVSFAKNLNQYASDKLILNAALKLEAKKDNITINDNDLATASDKKFDNQQAQKAYFDGMRKSDDRIAIINLENVAYQSKLQNKLLDKKNLTVVTMVLDTPYFHSLPKDQVQPAYDAAKARLNKTFLPLVTKGLPEAQIAKQGDVMYNESGGATDSQIGQQLYLYFHQGVVAVSNIDGYQKGLTSFNDISDTSWNRGNIGKVYDTADKVNQLKNVGDNTGVFASKSGALMIIRLDSKTGGHYDSWADFLNAYKSKYAHGKLQLAATSVTSSAVGFANRLVSDITTPGLDQAWAASPFCGDVSHEYPLTVVAWDMVNGVPISGVTLYQTRYATDSYPDSSGTLITPASSCGLSPQQATSNSHTDPFGSNTYTDNCYDTPPHFSVGPDPSGYVKQGTVAGTNARWQHNAWPGSPNLFQKSGFPDPPNDDGVNHIDPGLANGNHYLVVLEYNPIGPSWTLSPNTGVAPSTVTAGQHTTFSYSMYNNGPSTANYQWHVIGSYNGGGYSASGLPSGTVGSQGPSSATPKALANYDYTFPAGAGGGTKYCQELVYNNYSVPGGTGFITTGPNCVTLGFNPIQSSCQYVAVASPGAGKQALVRVQDSSGNVLVPGGSNPSTSSPTTTNYLGDQNPAAYNPTGPGYPSGRWTNQAFFIVGSTSGGTWLYTPLGTSIEVTVIVRDHSSGSWQTTAYSDTGYSCYNASTNNPANGACSLSVTGGGPGGVVIAGGTMHVTGTIYNTGPADLPASVGGHLLQLNNGDYNGNGSNWGFSQYPSGDGPIAQGSSSRVSFDIGVGSPPSGVGPNDPWSATLSAHPAYSGGFAFGPGSDCGVTVNVYAPFTLDPHANVILYDSKTGTRTNESPDQVINDTWVTETGAKVTENAVSNIYVIPQGGGRTDKGNTSNGGPFGPGSTTCLYQGPAPNNVPGCDATLNNGVYPPNSPLQAGDTYCADISVDVNSLPGNTAYVGPGGDKVGGGPDSQSTCPGAACVAGGCGPAVIEDKPFFKVNNGSVSAGGAFKSATPSCSGGGSLGGWNDNTGINPAPGDYGAGAQIGALALGPTLGVASNQSVSGNSPISLSFANNNSADKSVDTDSPKLGGNFNPGGANCFTEVTPPTPGGDFTNYPSSHSFPAGFNGPSSIAVGDNKTIFVTGDVYIGGNITYAGTGGGWSAAGSGNVPSFVLHATGNIYIAPGVTELDGLYESTGGKIYTCGSAYAPMPADQLFDNCNKQLTVYGSFVANQVDMMRTFGSLRDDAPVVGASVPTTVVDTTKQIGFVWNDAGGAIPGMRCTQVNEDSEPSSTTWEDNDLCVSPSSSEGACWTQNFAVNNPCTNCNLLLIDPSSDPYHSSLPSYWQDNALCTTPQFADGVSWSFGPPPPQSATVKYVDQHTDGVNGQNFVNHYYDTSTNRYCTLIYEDSDPAPYGSDPGSGGWGNLAWEHTYLCEPLQYTTTITVTAEHSPYPRTCSNGGSLVVNTCAAEVFYTTPELYLSTPNIGKPSNGAPQWDSITSLPPLL